MFRDHPGVYVSVCTENKERYLQSRCSVAELWGVGEILNKLEEEEQQRGIKPGAEVVELPGLGMGEGDGGLQTARNSPRKANLVGNRLFSPRARAGGASW